MERIIVLNLAVLCAAILFFENVISIPYHEAQQSTVDKKAPGENVKESYLWFGPRLGRKKRDSVNSDLYQSPERAELATLMDVIQDTPWAVVAVNEAKRQRHVVNYTPRLGRESGEESTSGDRWLQEPEISEEFLSQRSPPFAPRLGRHLSPFSPRLGRTNDKLRFS